MSVFNIEHGGLKFSDLYRIEITYLPAMSKPESEKKLEDIMDEVLGAEDLNLVEKCLTYKMSKDRLPKETIQQLRWRVINSGIIYSHVSSAARVENYYLCKFRVELGMYNTLMEFEVRRR